MVTIDQKCQCAWLILLVYHCQVLSFDKDSELAITDKVHEAFIFFLENLILSRLLIFSRVPCWVNMRLIFLLHVDHVRSRENAVKLAHKLSDALIVFFHSD